MYENFMRSHLYNPEHAVIYIVQATVLVRLSLCRIYPTWSA